MSLADKWAGIYKKKSQWRQNGINIFIKSVEDDGLREIIRGSLTGNVAISLYGRSQVGKTTFTLKLLGIKPEYFDELNSALRCGRPLGESATPTAMIYRRAKDDKFHYKEAHQEWISLDLNDLKETLIRLREKIESKIYCDLTEVIIDIPHNLFENPEKNFDIQICDLPGYGSKTKEEVEHVNNILKKYLPASGLILVFVQGHQIVSASDLFDNGIMDEIYGWKYFQSRYRLITTFSYSAESIRDLINTSKNFTKEDILNHYRKEARTSKEDNVPGDIKIYPFEFGDSYKNLELMFTQDQLDLIDNIMKELWVDLKTDIIYSSRSNNQVQLMRSIPVVIKRIQEEKNLDINRTIENKLEKKAEKELDIKTQETFCSNQEEQIRELEEAISCLKHISRLQYYDEYEGELVKQDMLDRISYILTSFSKQCSKINDELTSIDHKYQFNFRTYIENVHNEIFGEISGILNGIIFNKAKFGLLGGPKEKHKSHLNNNINNLNNTITKWNSNVDSHINKIQKELEEDISSFRRNISISQAEIEKIWLQINTINQQMEKTRSEQHMLNTRYDCAYAESNKINEILWSQVEKEKNDLLNNLNNKHPIDAFLDLHYLALITKDYYNQLVLDK